MKDLLHIDEARNVAVDGSMRAVSVSYFYCGHCPNLHVLMRDELGTGFADANLSVGMLERMLQYAKRIAANPSNPKEGGTA